MNPLFRTYTDGSSIGNPGFGGWVRFSSRETRDERCLEPFPGRTSRRWNCYRCHEYVSVRIQRYAATR
jgi:hypothetical protein